MRAVPVTPGQALQATVVSLQDGVAWFGYRGSIFAARTTMPLELGRSYDLTVVRTEPFVVLGPAKGMEVVAARTVASSPGGSWWLGLLSRLLTLDSGALSSRSLMPTAAMSIREPLSRWAAGDASSAVLHAIQRQLGHDQEARVLRMLALPAAERPAAAVELQSTAKARALEVLAGGGVGAPTDPRAGDAAHAFVVLTSAIERDNAGRSDLGLPQWLPLPACPAMGLSDARMFLVPPAGGDGSADSVGEAQPFTIVLLLEFTKLGAMRVDVAMRDLDVDLTFTAVQSAAAAVLLQATSELRADLGAAGLRVREVRVHKAADAQLPCHDLLLPPRDGSALVDCHA